MSRLTSYHPLILVTICLLLFGAADAQQDRYQFARANNKQGLSHNQVNSIVKDAEGFMWLGTMSGLNRFDGYTFKVFRQNRQDTASLEDNYIGSLWEAPEGALWIGAGNTTNVYNPATDRFDRNPATWLRKWQLPADTVKNIIKDRQGNYWFQYAAGLYAYPHRRQLLQQHIATFAFDTKHNLWLLYRNGVIEARDAKSLKVFYRSQVLAETLAGASLGWTLFIDAQDELWIAASADPRGAYYLQPATGKLVHFYKEATRYRLTANLVKGITQDSNGIIWICTDHGGVDLVNKKDLSVQYMLNDPNDEKSLSQNSITTVYKDATGIIWLGTYKQGICYFNENLFRFPLVRHRQSAAGSLPYEDVNRFAEDARGNWWIGTNGGGLIYYNRKESRFTQYRHDAANDNSLCSDVIVSLWIDHEQKLWIGTFYGGLDCFDGKRFVHYRHDPQQPGSIADNNIWELFEDSHHTLWVGTLSGGIDRFNREQQTFTHYPAALTGNAIRSNYISAIMEDSRGRIWFGTNGGIDILDLATGKFRHYGQEDRDRENLSNNAVLALLQDSRGLVWVATREGLSLFDLSANRFIHTLRREDGLPDNTVLTLLEDSLHQVWLSTPNGIGNIVPDRGADGQWQFRHRNFNELNNLQAREFNENAALRTSAGEMVFGGPSGFNVFDPAHLQFARLHPTVALTDLLVFNKSIRAGEQLNGRILLRKVINVTDTLILKYRENDFAIEFAGLGFAQSAKDEYAYKLDGFNKDWVITNGTQRRASYTNLDAGTYTFRVKAADGNGGWNEQETTLTICIEPPFWETPFAFVLYGVVIVGALWVARRITVARAHLRFKIAQQQKETERMHALDRMKIRFFTNVSHEFRTPLSLILAPLDKVIHAAEGEKKKQLQLIQRNARRLFSLVNQLLDFRKLEMQEFRFIPSEGEVIGFLRETTGSFSDIAEKKDIRFAFHTTVSSFDTFFDKDKLEKILFNLLSNAFKFTPQHGSIEVLVGMQAERGGQWLEIQVQDSGIGIAPEDQEKIFGRFFQSDLPDEVINQGSGIGLAITKEFVKLHGGTITVQSRLNEGSCFTVLLPLQPAAVFVPAVMPAPEMIAEEILPAEEAEEAVIAGKPAGKKATLLLVEDNDDFRFYLKDNLANTFHVVEAANGKDGWRQVQAVHPDLVVTDIMMPQMNGLDLARKIRNDPRTSHIPVVLLTAMATEEQQLEGFQTGANDYIIKPFSFEILLSRLRNLLAHRRQVRKEFRRQLEINPAEIAVTPLDEQFMKQALEIVEQHMSDLNFSVEELSRQLHMSRVALYKKLLSLTGKTPIEFIRIMRLKRAALLLKQGQLTVAEVAYEVGFNDPKNFARYFREEYGVLPSKYRTA